MPRLKIFTTLEEEAFESLPVFNSAERKRFFSLPLLLKQSLTTLRTPTNKVCFLVAAGYFKARRKFFARHFHPGDIAYVARQIGVDPSGVCIEDYSKESYARHQRLILRYFGFAPFDEAATTFAAGEIARLVRVQFRPKLVLLEIIQILTRKKIELPSYAMLADLIVMALDHHQQTLSHVVEHHQQTLSHVVETGLSAELRAKLDALLQKEPGIDEDEGWRYRLTPAKKALPIHAAFKNTRQSGGYDHFAGALS